MNVDPRASSGFGGDMHATYAAGRPSYPDDAIDAALQSVGLTPGSTVVDLAAGTGKLTRSLTPRFASVIAVEPLASMRAALHRELPDVTVLEGTAESIPLADASIDALFVAQAYHWFRPDEAAREFARVLRPGGGLVVVYNEEEWEQDEHPWLPAFRALVAPHEPDPGDFPSAEDRWRDGLARIGTFAPVSERVFQHIHVLDPDGFAALVASWSWIANLPDRERTKLLTQTRAILGDSRELRLRYRTEVYWTRQLASRPNRSRSR